MATNEWIFVKYSKDARPDYAVQLKNGDWVSIAKGHLVPNKSAYLAKCKSNPHYMGYYILHTWQHSKPPKWANDAYKRRHEVIMNDR